MDKNKLAEAIKKVKESSQKRKFTQSIDLIVTLKQFDVKKEKFEEQLILPHGAGKPAKVAAFIGGETSPEGCDLAILDTKMGEYKNKRKARKLARDYDFIISQANVMPELAQHLGKYLAPIGKMPNPKFGMIFPPKANIKALAGRLKSTVLLATKKSPVIQCSIGNELMDEAKLSENVQTVMDFLERKLKENVNKIMLKTTMGRPVRV